MQNHDNIILCGSIIHRHIVWIIQNIFDWWHYSINNNINNGITPSPYHRSLRPNGNINCLKMVNLTFQLSILSVADVNQLNANSSYWSTSLNITFADDGHKLTYFEFNLKSDFLVFFITEWLAMRFLLCHK